MFRQALLKSWQTPNALTILLWPLSYVYRLLIFIHRQLYLVGIKKRRKAALPCIVVGNLTVGGSGKTPLVIHCVELLKEQGFKPGVISRGYKQRGSNEGAILLTEDSLAQSVGDEPYLIAKRTQAPVAVGRNRHEAVALLEPYCDVVVSDDGLQHWALEPHVSICIDDVDALKNPYLLPAGPWRETRARLSDMQLRVSRGRQEVTPQAYGMQLVAGKPVAISGENKESIDLSKPIHAVAGIAQPTRFFDTCRELGFSIVEHAFPDHYDFQASDIDFDSQTVLMTEKDAVKCQSFELDNLWYLPVNADLSSNFDHALLEQLARSQQT